MATFQGFDGVVEVGGTAVGEMTSWTVTETAGTVEDSEISDTYSTFKAGRANWTAEIQCMWDDGDAQQEAMTIRSTVALVFLAEGAGAGEDSMSGNGIITDVTVSSDGGEEITTRNFSIQGTGALTHGTDS